MKLQILDRIIKKLDETLNWNTLSTLENNILVQRTLIFLFIIPILAKFLSKVENPIIINLNGYILKLIISLPFSWVAFYFSALAFTVSMLIFKFFAPKIVKDFATLGSRVNEGKIWTNLAIYLEDLNVTNEWLESQGVDPSSYTGEMRFVLLSDDLTNKGYDEKKKKEIHDRFQLLTTFQESLLDEGEEHTQSWEIRESNFLKQQFWPIFYHANNSRQFWRFLCSVFYIIGFGLIVYVFLQNIEYVLKFYNFDVK